MKKTDRGFILSTGKEFYANCNIIGINITELGELYISEGYDGGIDDGEFTKEERREVADYMIDLWKRFKHI